MRISFDLDGVLADMDTALAKIAEQEFGVRSPEPSPARSPGPSPRLDADAPSRSGPAGPGDAVRSPGPSGPGAAVAAAPDLPTAAILAQLSSRQQTRLWQRVRETRNFWETLAEHEPGTIRRIQDLAYHLRWEVLFVTQRPATAGRTAQVQSQRWLHKHGFDLPAVYTTKGSRGRIAESLSLDAHIDDRIENAVDIATDSHAWSILIWREEASFERVFANARKLNIAVVRTVGEALERIEAADRGDASAKRASVPVDEEAAHTGPALIARLKKAFSRG